MQEEQSGRIPVRLLIADSDPQSSESLSNSLREEGYEIASEETDGHSTLYTARLLVPDLVIVDFNLNDTDGIEVAEVLHREMIAPVVLLGVELSQESIRRAARAMVFSVVAKPVEIVRLLPAIEIALEQWKRMEQEKCRLIRLEEQDETRNTVQLAKRALMHTRGLSETAAYRTMRDKSMRTRRPMKTIAEEIVRSTIRRQSHEREASHAI